MPLQSAASNSDGSTVGGAQSDEDDGLIDFKPMLFVILGLSMLILIFLIFMALKSKDIFILKRKIRSNKYATIKV